MSGVDVLAFGPHPDDVELFCGGTLASLVSRGYRVGVVDLTRGEMASRGTPELRDQEANAAAQLLGLMLRENLRLPDTGIDPMAHRGAVVEVIRRLEPEVVLAPWSQARHPDHVATHRLVTDAVFYAGVRKFGQGPAFRPQRLLYYPMRVQATPSFVVDISAHQDTKRLAIECYASQLTTGAGDAPTLIGSPETLSVMETRDRYYGAMVGAAAGEPFCSPQTIGVSDPVAFFRENTFGPAQLFESGGGA